LDLITRWFKFSHPKLIQMPDRSNKFNQFWQELKRRKVIRVLIVYVAVGFAIIEFVDIVSEPLQLPSWALVFAIVLITIGFPLALILAWAYDITPSGIEKTEPLGSDKEPEKPISPGSTTLVKNSIVVLPFQNMSPEKDQDYFCDGITEEIINALTHIKSLKVIARTSSFAFKEKYDDVRKIGRELNVETILEGSVRKAGNRLRITAQLINVSDGIHFWSQSYDREMKDIFEIQDEISLAIVEKLKIELFEGEKEKILKTQTNNLEAYHLYLKGRHFWYNNRTWEGLHEAMGYFEKTIECDPGYALAYTGMADTYIVLMDWGYIHPIDNMPKIRELLSKSLEIEDSHAETYISLIYPEAFFDLDWDRAERTSAKALELNQNSPSVHHFYALYQMCRGNFDGALEHNRRAREIDPLSVIFNFACGLILYMARQYEKSIAQYRKALLLDNNFVLVHFWALYPHLQAGLYEEAVKGYQKLLMHNRETEKYALVLEDVFSKSGIEGALRWLIEEGFTLDRGIYNHPYFTAVCYANLKEKEKALEQLEKVMELKSPRMSYIRVEPAFDLLRSDPQFSAILGKIGLD
jgi:adenylate cyclase